MTSIVSSLILTLAQGSSPVQRVLLADSGAGSLSAPFQFILDEEDCLLCGGIPLHAVRLGGAYVGAFPLYDLSIQLPELRFVQNVRAVGVPSAPTAFDGIACFNFLNRFVYGNFGDAGQFGLES